MRNVQKLGALRRIDIEVVKRIIVILFEDGRQRKTKIALKSHVSYDKCLRYLNWLELMNLIKKEKDDGFEYINLTHSGIELYRKYKL